MRNHGSYFILAVVEFITNLLDANSVVTALGLIGVL